MDSESADRVDFIQALMMVCVDAGLQSFQGYGVQLTWPAPAPVLPPQYVRDPATPPVSIREALKTGALSAPAAGDDAGYEKLFGGKLPSFGPPPAKE